MITSKLGRQFLSHNEWIPRTAVCGWDEAKQLYFPYLDYVGKKLLKAGEQEEAQKYLTVGIGHLVGAGNFSAGLTEDQVAELFAQDLGKYEAAVSENVTVPLEQHEFDALVSFCFNEGVGAVNPAKNSAIRALNQGKRQLVPSLLLPWDITNGRHDPGLRNRRKAEGYLFSHPYPVEAVELPPPLIDLMALYRESADQHRLEDLKERE